MTSSTTAELLSIAEGIDRYRQRVGELVTPLLLGSHDDLVAAIHEAERQIEVAQRAVTRAVRVARS